MAIGKKFRDWYVGQFVPFENAPDSPIVFVGGYFERHWSARLVVRIFEFWRSHWKWCLTFLAALGGLVLAYLGL